MRTYGELFDLLERLGLERRRVPATSERPEAEEMTRPGSDVWFLLPIVADDREVEGVDALVVRSRLDGFYLMDRADFDRWFAGVDLPARRTAAVA